MARKMYHQFLYAINQKLVYGADKHSLKHEKKSGKTYSINDARGLRDTAKNFSNWMVKNHPDILYLKDIKPDHVSEWYADRGQNWTNKTLSCHISHMQKINIIVKQVYTTCSDCDFGFKAKFPENRQSNYPDCKIAMTQQDYDRLLTNIQGSNSHAKTGIQIAYYTAMRADEVCHLRASRIIPVENNGNVTVNVQVREGAKADRDRDILVTNQTGIAYLLSVKAMAIDRGNDYVCPIKADSLQKAMGRYLPDDLKEKYKHSKIHAIRKLSIRDFYREQLKTYDEKIAQGMAMDRLGHGKERRDHAQTYLFS